MLGNLANVRWKDVQRGICGRCHWSHECCEDLTPWWRREHKTLDLRSESRLLDSCERRIAMLPGTGSLRDMTPWRISYRHDPLMTQPMWKDLEPCRYRFEFAESFSCKCITQTVKFLLWLAGRRTRELIFCGLTVVLLRQKSLTTMPFMWEHERQ